MEHARPPAELCLEGGPATRSESWRQWRKQFDVFLKASGVSKEPKDIQASLLVNLIGSAGYEVYSTFVFADGETEDDINCVLKKFDDYFGIKPNITVKRYKFFTRNQEEGESIDDYVTALRLLSKQCDFGVLQESLLRDKIVCGIVNNTVRDRLLRTEDLTLSKAISICQAAEISKEESVTIDADGSATGGAVVDAVSERGGRGRRRGFGRRGWRGAAGWRGARRGSVGVGAPSASSSSAGSRSMRSLCAKCGSAYCAGGDRCPALNALCFVCDKKGHFSRVCEDKKMMRKVLNLSVDSEECSDGEDMFYVDTINEDKKLSKSTKEWFEIIDCNGKKISLKIDTGSMINVMSKYTYINIGCTTEQLKSFTNKVHSFTGNRLPIIGVINLNIIHKNKHYNLPFVIADLKCQNILGLEGCISLGLIDCVNSLNLEKYSCLFEGLGKLPGKYTIVIDKTVQPVISPTRKIPLGLKDKLFVELKRMQSLEVVRKVTHPTDWVNAIVLVVKKDGSIRVCLDPRPLNRAVRRAQYTLPTVTELAVKLRGASVFSVLDARSGFWMIELDDASADLCTFSTPFGRYQFLRLPYGISCAPEIFHARLRQHLEDLEGVESFVDDVIVWGRNKEEHDQRLAALLHRAQTIGIKFNREKCKFSLSEITYLGHKFDVNGMKVDDTKVKAILEMPYPTDRKSLERFLGMVNYLSKFISNYSDSVNVLRCLLKQDVEWLWETYHSEAVDKLKRKLTCAPVLAIYCTETPVVLSVDASSVAVGAVLLQNSRPVEFASLTLTDAQTRYAQIEKEMLAIVFAVERFRQYIYGRSDVTVHTDHKPLEALFNKPLVSVPARIQRMMMRVQGFDIKVIYVPGKYMYIADTLSRAPLTEKMSEKVSEEAELQTCFMLQNVPFSDVKIQLIREETEKDSDCKKIIKYIKNGWPKNRRDLIEKLSVFWPYRDELHFSEGIIFKSERVFIPRSLRSEMVRRTHEGHLGMERCKRRAREVMFWPGMASDVESAVRRCEACAVHAPRPRRQPLLLHEVPPLPWHKLASDIFEYKRKKFIILVDYFSNYVEVEEMVGMSSRHVIQFMKTQFARHGIPAELITDNGPAYSSHEFKQFMRDWEVRHTTSSPHYPQSNGKSERTVQTVKNMLKKCVDSGQDFTLSLLNFRATPRHGLDSPAQMLMGRRIRTKLPITTELLTKPVYNDKNYQALITKRNEIKNHYDKTARPLQQLSSGDKVTLVTNGQRKLVTVVDRAREPRSFIVEDEYGNRYRRTRSQLVLRKLPTINKTDIFSGQPKNSTTICDYKSIMAGIRRRRRTGTEQKKKLSDSSLQPGHSNSSAPTSDVSDEYESYSDTDGEYDRMPAASLAPSPSLPTVPIVRSRERTARMLAAANDNDNESSNN